MNTTQNIFQTKQKKIWINIYERNTHILPTQHYDYQRWLFRLFYLQHLLSRWRIIYHYVNNGSEECIVPLVVNPKRKRLRGLSTFGRLDYEDIISSTLSAKQNQAFLHEVFANYQGYHLHAEDINEDSLLYQAIGGQMTFSQYCVTINTTGSYDDWVARLGKHQRQNIRTAYNKINKEGFDIQLHQYDCTHPIPRHLWRLLQQIYEERGGDKGNALQLWYQRQKNAFTHILHHVTGHRIYVLMHDNTPIAYMAGMISHPQSSYYVPRLSHNITFNKYSPGILLICEVIKRLTAEKIKTLDLMRGDEPYKLAMGGSLHKNYSLDCMVDDLLDSKDP